MLSRSKSYTQFSSFNCSFSCCLELQQRPLLWRLYLLWYRCCNSFEVLSGFLSLTRVCHLSCNENNKLNCLSWTQCRQRPLTSRCCCCLCCCWCLLLSVAAKQETWQPFLARVEKPPAMRSLQIGHPSLAAAYCFCLFLVVWPTHWLSVSFRLLMAEQDEAAEARVVVNIHLCPD